jgi:hypothetical protein
MNEVTNFMLYVYNKWDPSEAENLFGESLGEHIFEKWVNRIDALLWYSELDKECRQKLVDRANEIYAK